MKSILRLMAVISLSFLFSFSAFADKLKVGFIYVGPIGDHGWTYMHDKGRLAVEKAFGANLEGISMSSTKSSIGHLLGAAGAVEAIFSILTIENNIIPATINLDDLSIDTKLDLVPHMSKEKNVDVVLSNSFGFGGTNASVIFSRYDEN